MQAFLPGILAVLIYLSSLFGFTPSSDSVRSALPATPLPPTAAGAGPANWAPASYPGATEVMAYYAENYSGDPAPYNSLSAAAASLTSVIPFSYKIDAAGRVTGTISRRMLQLARNRGLKVIALVHNAGGGSFSASTVHAFLNNRMAQRRAIDAIYSLLIQNGLDGVNVDLENAPAIDREAFTGFIQALASVLRPKHFLVTASLPAKTSDDRASNWSGAYDYAALSPWLDQVMLMAYDEHVAGSHPGPVASLAWVDAVVRYAAATIPRQKIVLGLPAYGYAWTYKGGRALSFAQIASLQRQYGRSATWDAQAQVPFFIYSKSGVINQVWYEDSRSSSAKADLVKRYGLRGVAVWRLGYEDPGLWKVLEGRLG